MRSRELVAAILLIALSAALFGVFLWMNVAQLIYIGEPNSAVRILEIVIFGLITIFAIWNFIKVVRS